MHYYILSHAFQDEPNDVINIIMEYNIQHTKVLSSSSSSLNYLYLICMFQDSNSLEELFLQSPLQDYPHSLQLQSVYLVIS